MPLQAFMSGQVSTKLPRGLPEPTEDFVRNLVYLRFFCEPVGSVIWRWVPRTNDGALGFIAHLTPHYSKRLRRDHKVVLYKGELFFMCPDKYLNLLLPEKYTRIDIPKAEFPVNSVRDIHDEVRKRVSYCLDLDVDDFEGRKSTQVWSGYDPERNAANTRHRERAMIERNDGIFDTMSEVLDNWGDDVEDVDTETEYLGSGSVSKGRGKSRAHTFSTDAMKMIETHPEILRKVLWLGEEWLPQFTECEIIWMRNVCGTIPTMRVRP